MNVKINLFLASVLLPFQVILPVQPYQKKAQPMLFNQDIFEMTKQNNFFRKEIVTGKHSQVVLMSVPVGGEIGLETHTVDQTLVFVQGTGKAILNGVSSIIKPGHLVFVSAGNSHNFINTGTQALKLFTVYAPSEHKPGTVEKVKSKG